MKKSISSSKPVAQILPLLRWALLIVPVAVSIGLVVAFFLWLLDWASATRWTHLLLITGLPLAGVAIVWLYKLAGKDADKGNNLVISAIHYPETKVPGRMAPLILISTIITHLFGGSAGREGTAVQIGGSIAAQFAKLYRLKNSDIPILLLAGMAAGFGAVFGTPITGAVFAIEVLAIGKMNYAALLPCLMASLVAHLVCIGCGISHTHYSIASAAIPASGQQIWANNLMLFVAVAIAGVVFGLVARLFSFTLHEVKANSKAWLPNVYLAPVVGGVLVIGISYCFSTYDYLGLGVSNPNHDGTSILSAFQQGGSHYESWFIKLLLTAITLGMGFKGGEVTPLFFIGATLGNSMATFFGLPVDLFAGLGFIAVFAGAINTPIACTLMGVELFGGEYIVYYAIACFMAYYSSGHTGIYSSQKIGQRKYHFF